MALVGIYLRTAVCALISQTAKSHRIAPGVIHVLDGLLQPAIPGFDPFVQAQDQADGPWAGVTAPLGGLGGLGGWWPLVPCPCHRYMIYNAHRCHFPLPFFAFCIGLFDPLGLWEGKGEEERARLRLAEVKHGRLAMLAAVRFPPFQPKHHGRTKPPNHHLLL